MNIALWMKIAFVKVEIIKIATEKSEELKFNENNVCCSWICRRMKSGSEILKYRHPVK